MRASSNGHYYKCTKNTKQSTPNHFNYLFDFSIPMLRNYSRESCLLMDQFVKYMVFGTQVYGIWKISFNMETYMSFMHSEPIVFFLPRLPLLVSRSAASVGHVSIGWNWTGWKLQNQILSFPQKHPSWGFFFPYLSFVPIPLICLHPVTKVIWASHKNSVADGSTP